MTHQQIKTLTGFSDNFKVEQWTEAFNKYLPKYEIDTPLRLQHFFAQVLHESMGLIHLEENLNYSGERLLVIFPKYFKTKAEADKYHRQPEKIANKVYQNRMGNGPEISGDGWKFRGKGCIQVTGKDNHRLAGARCFNDPQKFLVNPDLLIEPEYAVVSACWFFNHSGCNELADLDSIVAVTKRVNGFLNGIIDREKWLSKTRSIIK